MGCRMRERGRPRVSTVAALAQTMRWARISGAVRLARDVGPGKTIVTVLCDYGNRYQSKLFNPIFLKGKGLPVPHWLEPINPVDWRAVVEPDPA